MESADVVTALVAFAVILLASRLLKDVPFWIIIVLAAASYPVDVLLLPAWESVAGATSTWAAQAFAVGTGLAFAACLVQAFRGFTSLRKARAARLCHGRETDA
ncbi:hypothetical protein ACIQM0_38900 [Streptomyces sp. NPDC091387]|uniref:hypothetical protein n=1 Tax=Streptomyces sp. NPDC091387 TaxID=3365998 RepID=UPI0037F6671D